jgi:hypothetical protein
MICTEPVFSVELLCARKEAISCWTAWNMCDPSFRAACDGVGVIDAYNIRLALGKYLERNLAHPL